MPPKSSLATGRITAGLLAAFLLAGSVSLAGCRKPEAPKSAEAATVLTVSSEPAAPRKLALETEVSGSVAAWDPLPVIPAANGLKIVEVLAEAGDTVEQGQPLVRLDSSVLRAQLLQAKARLQSAQAQLAKMKRPSRPQELASAEAAVAQAEASLKSAQDAYDRAMMLKAGGSITHAEIVSRQAALEAGRAAVEQARQHLNLLKEGSRQEDLAIGEAQVAEAKAGVAQVQSLLDQTEVKAPSDGYLLTRDAHLGDMSSVAKPLYSMVRHSRLEVEALVPESDLSRVDAGQPAIITSDAHPGLRVVGKVRQVSPQVDAGNRLAKLEIDVPKAKALRVGMFVKARVRLGEQDVLAVPSAAVVTRDAGSEVFVLDGQHARRRQVVLGSRADGYVAVMDGLQAGENVIVNGVGFLKDGDRVGVAPALPKASAQEGK